MGQSTYERDRRGFKELAKLAGPQPRPKAQSISGVRRSTKPDENDSGMVDLEVLASSDPGAVDRASVTPLASTPLFGDDDVTQIFDPAVSARPSPPPAPPSVRPVLASAVPHATPSRPVVSAQATLRSGSEPKRRSMMGPVATGIGLAAIAAGAFLVVRTVRAPSAVAASAPVVAAPAVVAQAPSPVSASAIAPAAPTPAADKGVDPLTLPAHAVVAQAAPRHVAHTGHAHAARANNAKDEAADDDDAPPPNAEAKAAPPPAAPPAAKEAAAAPAPAANNTLLSLIAQSAAAPPAAAPAAGAAAADPTPVPAAAPVSGGAGLAPRPSQGQVTTALGGALPGARACLNDGDGVSRAHVVFGSDGAVQSVAVTGFAAGKPSEACIKTALGKAHVAPFAEASYGATVTVRP